MPLYSYNPIIADGTTYQMVLPETDPPCQEIARIDGVAYVSVPSAAILPQQPEQIAASVAVVVPDAELRSTIKAVSPHCALIKARGHQHIVDAGYNAEDQRKLDRLVAASGAGLLALSAGQQAVIAAYLAANLAADAWASEQYVALGL